MTFSKTLSRRLAPSFVGLAALTVGALAPVLVQPAGAATFYKTRLMVKATDSDGGQYAGGTGAAKVSTDGDWLGFSRLTVNGSFRKSLVSGEVTLVSLGATNQPANGPSTVEGTSANGDRILFSTAATNMGLGTTTARDLYLRDLTTNTTARVNLIGGAGTQVAVRPGESTLSDDGQTVAFASAGGTSHVYVRSMATTTSEQIDVSSTEVPGDGSGREPSISATGRYISFTTFSANLVANDQNFVSDVLVRDRQAGTTTRASLTDADGPSNLGSDHSSITDDGAYVAFTSVATNLVPGDTNDDQDVFRRDMTKGATVRISLTSNGGQADGISSHPDIATTGDPVAFDSSAANLGAHTDTTTTDVFLRYLAINDTEQADTHGSIKPNHGAAQPSVASGGVVAFTTTSTNLTTQDTNGASDAYVRRAEYLGPYGGYSLLVPHVQTSFGADPAENAERQAAIENGRLTPPHLIVDLAHRPAWAQHREPVARLYQAFFHRTPDLNGLDHWVKKRQGGTKLGAIAVEFAKSNEFKTAYGTVSNGDFVTLVYGNVLQRKPDAAGLDHWVDKMAGGMSRGDVMVAFSESSEGKRTLSPEVDSTLMGLALLGTMPPTALWNKAVTQTKAHGMPEWGAITYLNSPEYYTATWG